MSLTPAARDRRRVRMPVLAVTGAAWLAVLLGGPATRVRAAPPPDAGMGAALANARSAHTGGHVGAHQVALGVTTESAVTLTGLLSGWILMVVAMMAPLLIPALRHVRARSLQRRRPWAMALVTLGYLLTWVAVGPLLLMLAVAPSAMADGAATGVLLGLAVAVSWQASPLKQRCLNRRGAHPPLAGFGRAAHVDALRFGFAHGAWCVGSCWALMLIPLVVPVWHVGVMVAVSLWMWSEQLERRTAGGWRFHLPLRPLRIAGVRALTVAGR